MATTSDDMATRLAAYLLLEVGEISVSEIEALPTIANRGQARDVAHRLLKLYDAIPVQRRLPGALGAWEEVIRLWDRDSDPRFDPLKLAFAVEADAAS